MPIFVAPNLVDEALYRYWRIGNNASLARRVNITQQSGFYSVYFINCAEDTVLAVSGTVTWLNPFGYLSGSQMPFMMVYLFLACAYFVLFIAWTGAMVYNRHAVVRVQLCIHAALLVSFAEYFIYSGDWAIYNFETGFVNLGWNIATVLAVAQRSMIVSITALLIAMGYGLFRRQLKRRTVIAVSVAAVVVWISTGLSQMIQMLRYTPQTNKYAPPDGVEFLFVAAETFVNFWVALWSLYHLYRSSFLLKKYRQILKLSLFRRLIAVVVFAIVVAALLFLVDFFASVTGAGATYWRAQALFGASWPILWFIVVLAIVALFWPNDGNQLFVMFELPEEDPDTEMRSARNEPPTQRYPSVFGGDGRERDETIAPVATAADRASDGEDDDTSELDKKTKKNWTDDKQKEADDNDDDDDDDDDDASGEEESEEKPKPKASKKSKKSKKPKDDDDDE
jgi:hypothetical protein